MKTCHLKQKTREFTTASSQPNDKIILKMTNLSSNTKHMLVCFMYYMAQMFRCDFVLDSKQNCVDASLGQREAPD